MSANIIDDQQLLALKELNEPGDSDIVTELIDIFVDHSPRTIKMLKESFENKDRTNIVKLSHKLKGSCANLGAVDMRNVCQMLEEEGSTISWEEIDAQITKIEQSYSTVSELLLTKWREG